MQLIIKRADGGVSIGTLRKLTAAEIEAGTTYQDLASIGVAKWEKTPANVAVSFRLSEKTVAVPASYIFRDAWTDELPGPQIDVDRKKAEAILMGRIREARNKDLDRLDKEYARATGRKNAAAAAAIEAKRETLRNIPETVDLSAAKDIDALAALWPAEMPKP